MIFKGQEQIEACLISMWKIRLRGNQVFIKKLTFLDNELWLLNLRIAYIFYLIFFFFFKTRCDGLLIWWLARSFLPDHSHYLWRSQTWEYLPHRSTCRHHRSHRSSSFQFLLPALRSFRLTFSRSHHPKSIPCFFSPSYIHHFLKVKPQTPLVPKSSLHWWFSCWENSLHLISEFAPRRGWCQCIPKCVVGNKALWDINRHHMRKGVHVKISVAILCGQSFAPLPTELLTRTSQWCESPRWENNTWCFHTLLAHRFSSCNIF